MARPTKKAITADIYPLGLIKGARAIRQTLDETGYPQGAPPKSKTPLAA